MNAPILPVARPDKACGRLYLKHRGCLLGFRHLNCLKNLSSGEFKLKAIEIPEAGKGISETLAKAGLENWGSARRAEPIWEGGRTGQRLLGPMSQSEEAKERFLCM